MRQAIQLLTVSASVVFAAASATAPAKPKIVPAIPHPGRAESVSTETAIDGFEIAAKPYGAAGWRIKVKNNTDGMASIVWDESVFVAHDGSSGGRFIRGQTRKMDIAKSQPATPVPAHASAMEGVFTEKFVDAEETEGMYAKMAAQHGGVPPKTNDLIIESRDGVARLLNGGALNITIQLADGKKTWVGRVSGGK